MSTDTDHLNAALLSGNSPPGSCSRRETNVGKLAGSIARRLREKNVALVPAPRGKLHCTMATDIRGVSVSKGYHVANNL